MARYAAWAALGLAATASAALLLAPTGERMTATATAPGFDAPAAVRATVRRTTLLQVEGPSVLFLLAIPVLLAACLFLRNRWVRLAAAVALIAFCLLGAMSIGFAYLPAAVIAWWAVRPRRASS